ncbi:MAG TPA: hypothetical protein VGD37_36505 [Kofleriaceae bacterium]|jgi:hypothetical protein
MPVRVLAVLLAILVAAGVASPVLGGSPDAAALVDDGAPDLDPAITASPIALVPPVRRELGAVIAPSEASPGRLHRVWVFRPPR